MKNHQRIGYMERKAHERYPRYALQPIAGRRGVAEKKIPGGFLRVTYSDSYRWEYELDGRRVNHETAMAAFGKES